MEEKKVAIGFICPDCQIKLEFLGKTKGIDSGVCGETDVTEIYICPRCKTMFKSWTDGGVWDLPYNQRRAYEISEKDPEVVKRKLAAGERTFF